MPMDDDEEEAYSDDGFVPVDQTEINEVEVPPQVKENNFRTVVPIVVKNEINHPNFKA